MLVTLTKSCKQVPVQCLGSNVIENSKRISVWWSYRSYTICISSLSCVVPIIWRLSKFILDARTSVTQALHFQGR